MLRGRWSVRSKTRYRKDVEEHGSTPDQIPDLGTFTTPRIFQLAVEDQKGTPEESVKHEITTRTRSKAMPTGEVDSRALITASTSDGEDSPSQLTTEPKKWKPLRDLDEQNSKLGPRKRYYLKEADVFMPGVSNSTYLKLMLLPCTYIIVLFRMYTYN